MKSARLHAIFAQIMLISNKQVVKDFISMLEAKDIRHVIITPGSRNAPFSISLLNHPTIHAHSIVDERSAGFVALGMAQQLQSTVVLICTSGTAPLNFAPAIAEAYYQRVPLLVVTADRPSEWIDQGEGQSIRQRNVFRNYVKASFEINGESELADLAWYNVRIMDEALRLCTEGVRGPVHLNFPLREPLYGTEVYIPSSSKQVAEALIDWTLSGRESEAMARKISQADKVMVLAGQFAPSSHLAHQLSQFSDLPQVAVFTEAHSNLAHERFVTTIDRMILGMEEQHKRDWLPRLLITFGHNIISRKIKEYIRKSQTEHWHIDISGEGLDTLKHLTKVVKLHPSIFFEQMNALSLPNGASNYAAMNLSWHKDTTTAAKNFMHTAPWSDLKAVSSLMDMVPADSDVQMGNSSIVRYILLNDARHDLRYFGNRGVAGIDGCTSTAVGAAAASGKLTTLVTGDIGFFYDSNAFWNDQPKEHLRVIVINNGGGGIFRIIEGPASTGEALTKYFETAHSRSSRGLAQMYEVAYKSADSEQSLLDGMQWLYNTQRCAVLEVFTPREENAPVLKAYFAAIKEAVYRKPDA
jgi:2-succinyl-5-enolpyruvyl-6-hydroxy-3-cyclohexene-1-carboxylate synthase